MSPQPKTAESTCRVCQKTFRYTIQDKKPDQGRPAHCGETYCRALTEWTPVEWAGRARMAAARDAARQAPPEPPSIALDVDATIRARVLAAHAQQRQDLELDRLDLIALERQERAS